MKTAGPLLVAALCLLAGCSSFDREWREARATPPRDSFAGAWEGRWTSARHGNPSKPEGGRLRCLFTPLDAGRYRAHFEAHWLAFSGTYRVDFETRRRGRELRFRGEQDLGALYGGLYRCEGRATPEHFESDYESRYDAGRFEMRRPQ